MKKLRIAIAAGGVVIAVAPALADTCSNQTISNKTLHQLVVAPGTCILDHVTVTGGLTVEGGTHLSISNATVNSGINVQPGGELDVQNTTNGGGQPIPGSSTINGGIVSNNASDMDLRGSVIHGGISIAGPGNRGAGISLCGLNIHGGLTVTNANQYIGVGIGDGDIGCTGNIIDGSITIDNSVADLVGGTINGSLVCIKGGVVTNHSGDTIITGSNSCF